jgi:hypothetical protein
MENYKTKMKISTNNDKMTTNNLLKVSKRLIKNTKGTKLDMKIFFLNPKP